ncbi:MAG: T9SS type A sorting domain-containing protein [Flavobacteriaceae bacterium]|nr:T9SS type A sorting domain-containing protein [Bacteroidia bacterium]NNL16512.1 T9SS type A sorting domain-containing protein [Flavobacteriaceae bacterium]
MKNLTTFLIGVFLVNFSINAQNFCQTAVTIAPGSHSVSSINMGAPPPAPNCADNFGQASGAAWYRFQATINGLAVVSSDLAANGNTDTRLTVYTGTCGNLTCIEGNDDIDGPTIKTSEVHFPVNNGTFYYVVWDNSFSSSGFDFTLSETAVDCSSVTLPISEDFDDFNTYVACLKTETADSNNTDFEHRIFDWDGDGNDEDYVSNGSTSTIAKDDWIFSTPINLVAGHEYTITFKYNGADGTNAANENLDVYFMDGPSSGATSLANIFSATGILKNGSNQQAESMATTQSIDYISTATGTYYLAFNGTSPENTGSLLLFEFSVTDNTLGINDFSQAGIEKKYNKQTDVLTINSSGQTFDNLEIFNVLGQGVYSKMLSKQEENINLSMLLDGIYIIRISSEGKSFTTKLLKQ